MIKALLVTAALAMPAQFEPPMQPQPFGQGQQMERQWLLNEIDNIEAASRQRVQQAEQQRHYEQQLQDQQRRIIAEARGGLACPAQRLESQCGCGPEAGPHRNHDSLSSPATRGAFFVSESPIIQPIPL